MFRIFHSWARWLECKQRIQFIFYIFEGVIWLNELLQGEKGACSHLLLDRKLWIRWFGNSRRSSGLHPWDPGITLPTPSWNSIGLCRYFEESKIDLGATTSHDQRWSTARINEGYLIYLAYKVSLNWEAPIFHGWSSCCALKTAIKNCHLGVSWWKQIRTLLQLGCWITVSTSEFELSSPFKSRPV